MIIDEKKELDWEDLKLLVRRGLTPDHPCAREMVLVGRLQRALGFMGHSYDGLYGPHTHGELRRKELPLGRELSAIVRRHRRRLEARAM